jgi:elongation factor 3
MSLLEPPSQLLQLLHDSIPDATPDTNEDGREEILAYVAFLAAGLAEVNEFDAVVWQDVLSPYVNQQKQAVDLEAFRFAAQKQFGDEDDATSYGDDDDEDVEELCDVRFNLAYGGKILLHDTRLRLLKGRRYALVGQNGVGKTTLMNAINMGKLDGWPTDLVTAYVDSGSNTDPTYEEQIVMPYLVETTGRTKEECIAKMRELDFTDEMFEGTIGALSGGWQMKVRLVRAGTFLASSSSSSLTYLNSHTCSFILNTVLINPDIYLLDEPTNHLSVASAKWITDYLCSLTDQTVVTVSHDTTFLEKTCTDVIHYEQRDVWGPYRKLVHYKGTMSHFVELQPQAKHYFELASTDALKFEFPDPGRLEGIKTSTQKFLEMEHVDFKYPTATKNQLTDISLKMTLSTRAVLLGDNGAGKTVRGLLFVVSKRAVSAYISHRSAIYSSPCI